MPGDVADDQTARPVVGGEGVVPVATDVRFASGGPVSHHGLQILRLRRLDEHAALQRLRHSPGGGGGPALGRPVLNPIQAVGALGGQGPEHLDFGVGVRLGVRPAHRERSQGAPFGAERKEAQAWHPVLSITAAISSAKSRHWARSASRTGRLVAAATLAGSGPSRGSSAYRDWASAPKEDVTVSCSRSPERTAMAPPPAPSAASPRSMAMAVKSCTVCACDNRKTTSTRAVSLAVAAASESAAARNCVRASRARVLCSPAVASSTSTNCSRTPAVGLVGADSAAAPSSPAKTGAVANGSKATFGADGDRAEQLGHLRWDRDPGEGNDGKHPLRGQHATEADHRLHAVLGDEVLAGDAVATNRHGHVEHAEVAADHVGVGPGRTPHQPGQV